MHDRPWLPRAPLLGALLATSFAGCLVVSPLENYPEPGEGKAGAGAGGDQSQAGSSSQTAGEAGDASGGQAPSTGDCQTNDDCVRPGAGAPYRCHSVSRKCVAVASDECQVVLGPASHPNAIYIGAFATVNPLAPDRNTIFWSHELARDQLSGDEVGGLRGKGDEPSRPLVIVGCDNTETNVELALEHLVNNVEVPALLATLKPGDLRRAYEKYASKKLFYLSPVAVTETLVQDEPDGLIWNLLGQPADLAPAYAELLRLSEAHVRSVLQLEAGEQIRVAFVTTREAFDSDLADSVRPLLEFNQKSIAANAGNYGEFTITSETDLAQLGLEVATFQPHIVVSAAGEDFSKPEGLIAKIEFEWGAVAGGSRRPFYILSPYNAGDLGFVHTAINDNIETSPQPDKYKRFIGLSIAGAEDISLRNVYRTKLRSVFPDANPDSENYYDAVYYLAYAMYASSDKGALTGPGIADGMKRLLSGDESLDIGSETINAVFDALDVEGSTILLNSTLGPPTFDPETGVRPVDGGVFCFDNKGASADLLIDVLRYDRELEQFQGTDFPCFDPFFP